MRIELFGDEVEAIRYVDPTTGEILQSLDAVNITRPSTSLPERSAIPPSAPSARAAGAAGCAQRRRQAAGSPAAGAAHQAGPGDAGQVGYGNGVENYARHLAGEEGTAGVPD